MDKNNSPLINIENLHIHMDERMDSVNFYHPEKDNSDCSGCDRLKCDDEVEIDTEELVKEIQQETHLPMVIIERVLAAENKILDGKDATMEADKDEKSDEQAEQKNESEHHATDTDDMKAKIISVLAGVAALSLIGSMLETEEKEDDHGSNQ